MSRSDSAALIALGLDRDGAEPLQRQLYRQVREAVLAGRLAPGTRLPSSRGLARELRCSRNTVVGAYDQLYSEGYLEGQLGSGTYVSQVLPEELLSARPGRDAPPADRRSAALSRRGRALLAPPVSRGPRHRAFSPGFPEVESFPFELWSRALARVWRRPPRDLLSHGAPAGYPPLRRAIADYLRAVRALDCTAEQVIITSGAQQGLDLTARFLLDPGDRVWIEEPGYPGLRGPLIANGAEIVPVPVDGEGLSLEAGVARAPDARLAIVSPSHQYPLGVTMTLARRLALLDWARGADAWILEDDYDSEYRYAGRPLTAMQGLEPPGGDRVIYLGSFSKVLFPSIRLGYIVVPEDLAEAFAQARRAVDDHPSAVVQPVLADFIDEGHFAAHLRRMRLLYAERQAALVAAAGRHLSGLLTVAPDEAGMHLVARPTPALAGRMSDLEMADRAAAAGITVWPLSAYYLEQADDQGLMLGYAGVPEAEIEAKARDLAEALST